jgi:hypothetical protein
MTNHASTLQGSNKPDHDGRTASWSSYQTDIIAGEDVEDLGEGDVWVFGHTHYSCDFKRHGVRVFRIREVGMEVWKQKRVRGQANIILTRSALLMFEVD